MNTYRRAMGRLDNSSLNFDDGKGPIKKVLSRGKSSPAQYSYPLIPNESKIDYLVRLRELTGAIFCTFLRRFRSPRSHQEVIYCSTIHVCTCAVSVILEGWVTGDTSR